MSRQTCSMRELCIRLLALAVAGRAPQGHTQQHQEQQNGQPPDPNGMDQQQQQQQGEQRRSLSPEVRVQGGVEAVAGQLRESLALTKRMTSNKLLPKDLDTATQVRDGGWWAGRVGARDGDLGVWGWLVQQPGW